MMFQVVLGRRLLSLLPQQRRSVLLSLAASTSNVPRTKRTTEFGYIHDRCLSNSTLLSSSTRSTRTPSLSYHTVAARGGGQVLWWTAAGDVISGSGDRRRPNYYPHSIIQQRWFTPMSKEEETKEQTRVKSLTSFQKDQELRNYNRQLAKLELLKGINTGEIYTWTGRYKALARDYGMPLFAYYWVVWTSTAIVCYGVLTIFSIDCLALIGQVDHYSGWDISSKVDPEMGKIGTSILLNELLEPLRLPAVILTVKPVMDNLFPPKY
jgi:hypothetical protein